jgi:hypothetical protein
MQTSIVMGERLFVVTDVHVVYPLGRTVVCIRERLMSQGYPLFDMPPKLNTVKGVHITNRTVAGRPLYTGHRQKADK